MVEFPEILLRYPFGLTYTTERVIVNVTVCAMPGEECEDGDDGWRSISAESKRRDFNEALRAALDSVERKLSAYEKRRAVQRVLAAEAGQARLSHRSRRDLLCPRNSLRAASS